MMPIEAANCFIVDFHTFRESERGPIQVRETNERK